MMREQFSQISDLSATAWHSLWNQLAFKPVPYSAASSTVNLSLCFSVRFLSPSLSTSLVDSLWQKAAHETHFLTFALNKTGNPLSSAQQLNVTVVTVRLLFHKLPAHSRCTDYTGWGRCGRLTVNGTTRQRTQGLACVTFIPVYEQ